MEVSVKTKMGVSLLLKDYFLFKYDATPKKLVLGILGILGIVSTPRTKNNKN
jgi:hypothetical protein